jgi:hypothetical protein
MTAARGLSSLDTAAESASRAGLGRALNTLIDTQTRRLANGNLMCVKGPTG